MQHANKLAKACENAFQVSAKDADAIRYISPIFIIAPLPVGKPRQNFYQKESANFNITFTAHPDFGLPYGSVARLLLIWLITEIVKSKNNIITLGKSFSAFLKQNGFSTRGGKRSESLHIKNQLIRLLATNITTTNRTEKLTKFSFCNNSLAAKANFWWQKETDLKDFSITVQEHIYQEIKKNVVPVDIRIITALRRSPLQIDILIWLTYKFYYLKKLQTIKWPSLESQFSNFSSSDQGKRDFKRQFIKAMKTISVLYDQANYKVTDEGLILLPSQTFVTKN